MCGQRVTLTDEATDKTVSTNTLRHTGNKLDGLQVARTSFAIEGNC